LITSTAAGGSTNIITASSGGGVASLFALSPTPGNNGEQVYLKWGAGASPQLYHSRVRTTGATGALLSYNVKSIPAI